MMNHYKNNNITIIGCGLAGSFLAFLLAKKGYTVDIYEKLAEKEIIEAASKRSYNIVLFGYGIEILKKTGLWECLKPHLLPLKGSVTHIKNMKPVITIADSNEMPYFTISRALLAHILLTKASEHPSVKIHFETTLLSIDRHEKTMVIKKTNTITKIKTDVIIGADGANSLVRSFIQQGQHTHHMQEFAKWRYRQFVLSPETVEKLNLEKGFVHTWTQKNAFIIFHPDATNALSALLVFPKNTSVTLASNASIKDFFTKTFPEFLPVLNEIAASILKKPDGNFATIHTDPWYYRDFIAIIGDAAHGFYPFFGQGASAAFGDCMQLVKLIDQHNTNWGKIFPLYQENRKKHTDALGDLSKEVLLKYLRHKRGDYDAIYDKLELTVYRLFPKFFHPPLALAVITDPEHAYDYQQHELRQRKIAKRVGIAMIITFLTGIVAFYEEIRKRNT